MGRDPQRLADREEPDGDDHDVDAVGELEAAEGEALLAGHLVEPDETERETDEQGGEAPYAGAAEHGRDRDEGQHHDREVVRGADVHGERRDRRGQRDQQDRADHAAREVADGGGREGL
jgi:hypothetical protein